MFNLHLDAAECTLGNDAYRQTVLGWLMNVRRLRVELRQFQDHQSELQEIFLGLATKSKTVDDARVYIDGREDSRAAVAASQELLDYLLKGRSEPTSVSQAVDEILGVEGATKYSDIVARVREYYPEIAEKVTDLDNTVYAALDYWLKAGKFRRVEKGVYERIGELERRRLKRKTKEAVPSKT